eukprot:18899-Heterococcus_DN1.PRE.1
MYNALVLHNCDCCNAHTLTITHAGSFRALYKTVFPRNVTEFSYRYHDGERARILLSYQSLPGVSRASDAVAVQEALAAADYDVTDLSGNELAKLLKQCQHTATHYYYYYSALIHLYNTLDHARHFVGGRAPSVAHERLYRFEFPEAPGALNRNHGSDFGRVLVGLQRMHAAHCYAVYETFYMAACCAEAVSPYTCKQQPGV